MATAVWTGTLGFGLVTIPIALAPATSSKDIRFHLFDPTTRGRIRYRRVVETNEADEPDDPSQVVAEEAWDASSPTELGSTSATAGSGSVSARRTSGPGDEVEAAGEYGSLLRGYEIGPDRFVMLDPEDLARIRPERSKVIEIEDFVPLADIDPVYFERSYHVTPRGPAGVEPYRLLVEAMERAGRVGIGRFVLRTRPHLIALRPAGDGLILHTLFFADEVRPSAPSGRSTEHLREREVALAIQLVEALATDWVPERYGDEYRRELLELLSTKDPQRAPAPVLEGQSTGDVERLFEALQRSVEAAKRGRDAERRTAS